MGLKRLVVATVLVVVSALALGTAVVCADYWPGWFSVFQAGPSYQFSAGWTSLNVVYRKGTPDGYDLFFYNKDTGQLATGWIAILAPPGCNPAATPSCMP